MSNFWGAAHFPGAGFLFFGDAWSDGAAYGTIPGST